MDTFVLMHIGIKQIPLSILITLHCIMAQPIAVSMKNLPSSSKTCNTSMFLKICLHSIHHILLYIVLLIIMLKPPSNINETIRISVRYKLHSSENMLIRMYHSKSSRSESKKLSNVKNHASQSAKIGYLKYLKSSTYLTNWCFNMLTSIFQNFRHNIRQLTIFSFISKLVRKACELSKMRKCSSFSRAPPISLLRMSQIHFRFGQKYVFYSSFFAFLRNTSNRTTQKITPIKSKNYALQHNQVTFMYFAEYHAKIKPNVSKFKHHSIFAGPDNLSKRRDKQLLH